MSRLASFWSELRRRNVLKAGGTGKSVRIRGVETWTMAENGLIAQSVGHFDEAEYRRRLEQGIEDSPASRNEP